MTQIDTTTYQEGRGVPFIEPQREVPTGQDQITPYTNPPFNISLNGTPTLPTLPTGGITSLPQDYEKKSVRVIQVDLTNTFDDQVFNIPGTLIFFSGQVGGTAAPCRVRLDNFENDRMTLIFDRGISGVPFKQFYLTNTVAQPGIAMEITVISDRPFDRVGVTG